MKNQFSKIIWIQFCFTVIFMVIFNLNSFAQEGKVRIIKEDAVLRLEPNNDSSILRNLPIGAILDVEETVGEWIKIKLPPDKDGFVVTGYIHGSFVEFRIKPKAEKDTQQTFIQQEKKTEVSNKGSLEEDYYNWKKELSSAKSRSSTGLVLTVAGGLIFTSCMILTFVHQRTEYHLFYYEEKARVPYLVGDGLGLVMLIAGLALHLPARGTIRRLEKEGRIKGYIETGLLERYNALGVQIGISF